jgi:hypothetical protein
MGNADGSLTTSRYFMESAGFTQSMKTYVISHSVLNLMFWSADIN